MNFELTIERWAWAGQGLGHHEGKAVFIGGTLPGERVIAEPVKSRKNYMEARLVQVIETAPQRIEPTCPHYPSCGGCGLLHLGYEDQLLLKKSQLQEQLERQQIEINAQLVASPKLWNYRYKGSLKTTGSQIGLNRYRSPQVLPIPECQVFSQGIKEAIAAIAGNQTGDLMALESQESGKVALVWNRKGKQQPQAGHGQQVVENYGFGDLRLDAGLFAQSNPQVVSLILSAIQNAAASYENICEHYAGSGTISHVIAPTAKNFWGYEASVKAAKRGNQNLVELGILSGEIKAQKAEQASIPETAELLVVDPPRSGMAAELIGAVSRSKVSRIIYLSCDVQTQARDLNKLQQDGGFVVEQVTSFDMYVHTGHQETLAILSR